MQAPPADFAEFVAAHGRRLGVACQEIAGNDRVADSLRTDLLAAVALRWRRWWRPARRRTRDGLVHLDRLLRREVRTYQLVLNRPGTPPTTRMVEPTIAAPLEPDEAAELADAAWRRRAELRRTSRITVAAAVLLVMCLVVLGPRPEPQPAPPPRPPDPVPTGVTVLPAFADLLGLSRVGSALPLLFTVDTSLPALSTSPVNRAVALLQADLGPLLVVGDDRTLRRIDDPGLARAQLLTTSLSPDGDRAVLVAEGQLVVVDLHTAAVHLVSAGSVQPTLTWRTPHSVVVPGASGAREVDVDTGAVTELAGVTGVDVVSSEGTRSAPLTEMVALSSTGGQTSRIRFWRSPPGSTVDIKNVEDRPIFGPQWIGAWLGPGWSSPTLFVRACASTSIVLPPRYGQARLAIGALLPNGIHAGTLVTVDDTQIDPLGFLLPQTVLVSARTKAGTVLLSWEPAANLLLRVTTSTVDLRVSVADLLPPA